MALQTFNTDSIRAHAKAGGGGSVQANNNHSRIAQSHSPTQIHRKNENGSGNKPAGVGLKQQLGMMNSTFHAGGKAIRGAPYHQTNGAF